MGDGLHVFRNRTCRQGPNQIFAQTNSVDLKHNEAHWQQLRWSMAVIVTVWKKCSMQGSC